MGARCAFDPAVVDALGMLLLAIVHADIQNRGGGIMLLAAMFRMHPFLKKLFADGGNQYPKLQMPWRKSYPISKPRSSSDPTQPRNPKCRPSAGLSKELFLAQPPRKPRNPVYSFQAGSDYCPSILCVFKLIYTPDAIP